MTACSSAIGFGHADGDALCKVRNDCDLEACMSQIACLEVDDICLSTLGLRFANACSRPFVRFRLRSVLCWTPEQK